MKTKDLASRKELEQLEEKLKSVIVILELQEYDTTVFTTSLQKVLNDLQSIKSKTHYMHKAICNMRSFLDKGEINHA
jgi:hypothetical protein